MFAHVQLPDVLARPTIELSGLDLALAGGLVLLAVGISHWHGLGLERAFLVGALRTVVQLILVGYVLLYVFALERWYVVLAVLLLMLVVATWAAVDRQEGPRRALLGITGAALLLGSGVPPR